MTRGDDLKYDYQSLCDEAQKRLKGSCVDDDLRTNSFAYKYVQHTHIALSFTMRISVDRT